MIALVVAMLVVVVLGLGFVVREARLVLARIERVDDRVDDSLRDAALRMQGVGQELQAVHDAALQMRDITRGLARFAEVLGTPSARGRFGELLLERLLAQVLPGDAYSLQHQFSDGRVVDAVIRLGGGLVPVDAKFPLESYARLREADGEDEQARLWRDFARTVKTHTDAVARYIRPGEATFEFALMYVPAEAVYYECFVRPGATGDVAGLQDYALERRVITVSPNSFYGYLQAIALGLRGLRVEEEAQVILGHLGRLQGDVAAFRQQLGVLGSHLGRAKNKFDELAGAAERMEAHLALSTGRTDESGLA